MSIARHHAEWLSLLEISGPFLSMPVLLKAFPQGLDAHDTEHYQDLRAAYEEWADNQGGLAPEPAIHRAWLRFVLGQTLALPEEVLVEGQAIPEGVKATLAEHDETIRPDLMVVDPDSQRPCLLIQTYPAHQKLEQAVPGRNWKAGPATRLIELLHATETRLGMATNGEQWLLVAAKRGETTAFVSWYAGLWTEERLTLRAFRTLLGAHRFFGVPDVQTLPALLDASAKDQHEVTDQLGYQVRRAVEILIQAVDRADQDRGRALLAGMGEGQLYEAALTVMMRLVFLLTAEERDLLLLGDPIYDQYYAVSTLRAQLREQADRHGEEILERGFAAWCRLLATFRAVYGGVQHENLNLPAYGGSLFDPERFPFLEGRSEVSSKQSAVNSEKPDDPLLTIHRSLSTSGPLPINNRTVLHLLEALQILQVAVPGGGPAEARRISFRALDIEQIGHIYEGLLDHHAVRAGEPVVGLVGTKNKEPEIPLSRLEEMQARGAAALATFLRKMTGRSENALKNSLKMELDGRQRERLRAACGNDDELYRRLLPFAGLVRNDNYGWPVLIPTGSAYVTAGTTRRATGTHYTPRSLTEPIVRHTLEPLVYTGPAEGHPREQWRLRSPKELLELKVCDMAMGSGAFLVQACRYLSERLVETWEVASGEFASGESASNQLPITSYQLQITPEGHPSTGDPGETIIPDNDEERLALARRLVADRCLYGVDKNHLAVEMAKLSLWLVTLDKQRPFTFLDHGFKHGDSLIGADEEMFLHWSQSLKGTVGPLYYEENERALALARHKRQELQAFTVRDVRDAEEKAQLLAKAEAALARIKRGCDLIIGVRLLDGLHAGEQEAWLAELLIEHTAKEELTSDKAKRALQAAQNLPAFHWPFEFPEVLAQGGFSAFMGNPPFLGGTRVSASYGNWYLSTLQTMYKSFKNRADLCSLFLLRGFQKLVPNGNFGFITTNTISQGDTREAGLDDILRQGGTVYKAVDSAPWPGVAAITISIVHVHKGSFAGRVLLNGNHVSFVSANFDTIDSRLGTPKQLKANEGLSFNGSKIDGRGFIIEEEEAQNLITWNKKNANVLKPFLVGRDVNSDPAQKASRWVIFFSDWDLSKAEQYPDCLQIVKERVFPDRQHHTEKRTREHWWQFQRIREELYETITDLNRVLICSRVSKNLIFTFVRTDHIFSEATVITATDKYEVFASLQSEIHAAWAWQNGSTMRNAGIRYTSSDVFETFPFPHNIASVQQLGISYHAYRGRIMLDRQEGLTATYNRFHDPQETAVDIAHLRQLHVEMDNAIAAAYGWQDIDLGHGFHETAQGIRYTVSEPARREVLTRLLKLNHERYAEEVCLGLHEKKQGGKGAKEQRAGKKTDRGRAKKNDGQMSLL
jgi:hypothetical protein